MTAVSSGGVLNSSSVGANLDIPVSNVSSLRSLFNSTITIYPSQQSGQPAQWWATSNTYLAYTTPLVLPLSSWYSTVPGGPSYELNCNLQGINIGK